METKVFVEIDNTLLASLGLEHTRCFCVSKEQFPIKSYRIAVFEIVPALLHYTHDKLMNMLDEQLTQLSSSNTDNEVGYDYLKQKLDFQRNRMKDREQLLYKLNEKEIQERRGMRISYDATIQLRHVDTQQFLTSCNSVCRQDKSLSTFNLTNEPSTDVYLGVKSLGNASIEGEYITYDSPIRLQIVHNCLYMAKGTRVLNQKEAYEEEKHRIYQNLDLFPMLTPRRAHPILEMQEVHYLGTKTAAETNQSLNSNSHNVVFRSHTSFNALQQQDKKHTLLLGDYIRLSVENYFLSYYGEHAPKTDMKKSRAIRQKKSRNR